MIGGLQKVRGVIDVKSVRVLTSDSLTGDNNIISLCFN